VFCNSTVSAWEAKLLPRARFMEIADSPNLRAALSMLEDTEYQPSLREIPREAPEIREVERALHAHVVGKFKELLKLVPEESKPVVRKLMEWRDLWNLKAVATAIHNQVPKEERIRELLPSPTVSEERLQLLCSAESLKELLEFLKGSEYYEAFSAALSDYERYGLLPIIASLEKKYYSSLWEEVRRRKPQRKIFRKLVGFQVDALNARVILRLREAGIPAREIEKFVIKPAHELSEAMLRAMITAEDMRSAIHAIRITAVGRVLSDALTEIESEGTEAAERALEEAYLKLCKWTELANQFSIAPVVSYLAQKEAELKSLRLGLRLKADGFEPREIKERVGGRA
jgi:V/A-type H+-transporting ATPase subunit C